MMESLKLPATLESLKVFREFIKAVATRAGFSPARTYGLVLAVDEITTNITMHGYQQDVGTGDILVHANVTDDAVEITIEDSGVPFNPLLQATPHDLDAPLEERSVGGLGIFLARQKVDEFRYDYRDGRNHNIFVIRQQPALPLPKS